MKTIPFPKIQNFDTKSLREPLVYIGAAGFEDRALAVLNEAKRCKKAFEYIIEIEYKPDNPRNRKEEFYQLAREVISQESNIERITFNREDPSEFSETFNPICQKIRSQHWHVCLDISAMSKMLILVLLDALRDVESSLTIAYAEAKDYHPTPEEFERIFQEKEKSGAFPKKLPGFPTTGVYGIVTTPALSSVATQGYPTLLIAFPTFNYQLSLALLNEVTFQDLVILEGEPLRDKNKWRREAVRKVNELLYSSTKKDKIVSVSTFYYDQTINQLEELYSKYQYTHEFVIAPANAKLQTVGVFFFKQMHPDVQIVYPTPKSFFKLYTEGIEQIHQISFPCYSQFLKDLDGHRYFPLKELREKINVAMGESAKSSLAREGKASAKIPLEFQKARQYFELHKQELLQHYRGKYIAIWQEEVIDADLDFSALAERVYDRVGYVPVYMPLVIEQPRILKIPSPKVVRD